MARRSELAAVVLLLLLLLLVLLVVPPFAAASAALTGTATLAETEAVAAGTSTCSTCVQEAGKGYCWRTATCEVGTAAGNAAHTCNGTQWFYGPHAACVDPCAAYAACDECDSAPVNDDCIWCLDHGTLGSHCMTYNAAHSTPCAGIGYSRGNCPILCPLEYNHCAGCSQVINCGWCLASQTCMAGSRYGSTDGMCTSVAYDWLYDTCSQECQNFGDCKTCIEDGYGLCSWCNTGEYCTNVNSTGAYCPGGLFNGPAQSCPAHTCDSYTDCSSCTADPGCGWCAAARSCMSGTQSGPYGFHSCQSNDWMYDTCFDPCVGTTGCQNCLTNPACGWCHTTQTCTLANAYHQPANGTCAQYYGQQCPETCAGVTHCSGCVFTYDCGWCLTTGECMLAAGGGVSSYDGTCSGQAWDMNVCSDPCSIHQTCGTCTASANCGWCAANDRCSYGNAHGPELTTCSANWVFGNELCPLVDCSTYATCGTCAQHAGCGWCWQSQQCLYGNSTSSEDGSCAGFGWNTGTCQDPCAGQTSCSSCLGEPGAACGWCGSSLQCEWGATETSYCSDWIYQTSCPTDFNATCAQQTTCSGCIDVSGLPCGWCGSTSKCLPGGAVLPSDGYHCPTNWRWGSCPSQPGSPQWAIIIGLSCAGFVVLVVCCWLVVRSSKTPPNSTASAANNRSRAAPAANNGYQPLPDSAAAQMATYPPPYGPPPSGAPMYPPPPPGYMYPPLPLHDSAGNPLPPAAYPPYAPMGPMPAYPPHPMQYQVPFMPPFAPPAEYGVHGYPVQPVPRVRDDEEVPPEDDIPEQAAGVSAPPAQPPVSAPPDNMME